MRELDDKEREEQLRRDPRRDPTVPPPADSAEDANIPPSSKRSDEQSAGDTDKPTTSQDDEPPSSRRRDVPPAADQSGGVVTSQDPRIAELEPMVATANWEAVLKTLGPKQDAGKLPPNLGLLYALAYKEHHIEKEAASKKSHEKDDYDANAVAIRCMAGLFGVQPDSGIALVLGKRLIRSNPVAWQKKKAPPAPISILIVALGLAIGAGIGWLLSFGYITVKFPGVF